MKHTPGPWKIKQFDSGMPIVEFDSLGQYASVCGKDKEANAKLITASPELLEALKELENVLTHSGKCQCCSGGNDEGHEDDCRLLKARAAIENAEGRAV